jgi:nicotinamide phosphoribosyltransferase
MSNISFSNISRAILADSYKYSHYLQYPEGTTNVFSYIEPRGGNYPKALFYGLQGYIKKYLLNPVTKADVDFMEQFITQHGLPFNREGWDYILEKHNGYLPLRIKAVKEGRLVPVKNVLVTVENTDPKCAWLTSFVETDLLRAVWYPTTVATRSYEMLTIIDKFMQQTVDEYSIDKALFSRHDFSQRGNTSYESSGIAGSAALLSSKGTDTTEAILYAQEFYDAEMIGFSIPASEHSVSSLYGQENELGYLQKMIKEFGKPEAIFAGVADTYDIFHYCESILPQIKDSLIASGGRYVCRPDSGNPLEVSLYIVRILDKVFGSSVNSKGYKVLNPCIRMIYGDSITETSLKAILENFAINEYSAENIAFGCGGFLTQQLNRDTMQFAMKASAAIVSGKFMNVSKNPVTDSGKRSKAGRLELVSKNGEFKTCLEAELSSYTFTGWTSELEEVYCNGKLLRNENFETIRQRVLDTFK